MAGKKKVNCQLPGADLVAQGKSVEEAITPPKHAGGRPTDFTPDNAETILALIMEGKSLVEICKLEDMPHYSTVCRWLARHKEFGENYARAREVQMDYMAEEIKLIADTPPIEPHEVGWQKNRIEARKWLASKIFPKKYGDKITQELTGTDGGPIEIHKREMTEEELLAIASRGRARNP